MLVACKGCEQAQAPRTTLSESAVVVVVITTVVCFVVRIYIITIQPATLHLLLYFLFLLFFLLVHLRLHTVTLQLCNCAIAVTCHHPPIAKGPSIVSASLPNKPNTPHTTTCTFATHRKRHTAHIAVDHFEQHQAVKSRFATYGQYHLM